MTDRMTTEEAATYLRYAVRTLQQWRYQGRGPVYLKVGRLVWYRKQDLDRWEEQVATIIKPRKVI